MLRIVGAVVALLIVSSTSSAHELRPLIAAPLGTTPMVSPLVVVELPLGVSRFDVLSLRSRLQIRRTVIERGSNRIVVLRTLRAVRLLPQVVRSRSRGRTLLLRRR